MASFVFRHFKDMMMRDTLTSGTVFYPENINTSATFIMALVTSAIFVNSNIVNFTNTYPTFQASWDISNNPAYNSSGYTSGAKRIFATTAGLPTSIFFSSMAFKEVSTSSMNITWPNSTIDAYGAVIYKESTSENIIAIDFGSKQSSINGNFQIIQPSNTGFLELQ